MNVGSTIHLISEWLATDPTQYPAVTRGRTDPTTLTCVVTAPSGATQSFAYPSTIARTATGVFYVTLSPNEAGVWSVAWVGTGTAAATCRKTFNVSA